MSKTAEQAWALIEQLPPDERQELSDRLIRESLPDYGDLTDDEITASAARIFKMLDEEENAAAR